MLRILPLVLLSLPFSFVNAESISVRAKPLNELLEQSQYSAPASVIALNSPDIAAEISARVLSIPVRVGDGVKKGELLVRLDCDLPDSRLKAAQAQLRRIDAQIKYADVQLKRAKNLKRKQSISEETLDQRHSELATLNADRLAQKEQIRQAEIEVEHCRVYAPFDAVVVKRISQVGSMASPGSALLHLVQLDQVEVSADLNEFESHSLQQSSQMTFVYADKEYPLTLRRILPLIDEQTRTQELRLVFSQDDTLSSHSSQEYAPIGAAGRVKWQGWQKKLPSDYLEQRDNQLGIFILNNSQAVFYPIPAAQIGKAVGVELADEQLVVTEGRQRLQDGDSIILIKEND